MSKDFEALGRMEYPGRLIIIGMTPNKRKVVLYGITGRSELSRARRLDYDDKSGIISVNPTDKEILEKGNPDLLIYPCIITKDTNVIVSNGNQTKDIFNELMKHPYLVLTYALDRWSYEPDEPNFTPRISGVVSDEYSALSIIKRDLNGSAKKDYFHLPLAPGEGKLITTYTGVNINPLPSFEGKPLDVEIKSDDIQEITRAIYSVLNPNFRVAVAGVHVNVSKRVTLVDVINRCDIRKGGI